MNELKKETIPKLSIILPCFNEEEVIESSISILHIYLKDLIRKEIVDKDSFLCFVDDGSKDKTLELLLKEKKTLSLIKIIKLSRNFGHQSALLAGLEYCKDKCDCSVTIDADLQDDHTVIGEMINKYYSGCEVVYGVRNKRDKDSFFKKRSALAFYKLMNKMGATTINNHADFRLLSRRAVSFLFEHREVNLFLRGIVPMIGLKTDVVYYERKERTAGETKYPLKKMISFAIDGVTSFSIQPLRFVTLLGIITIIISLFIGGYILISYLLGHVIAGWTSLIVSVWFLGGIQLLCIGIIGEYIGKIYKETKERPRFLIETKYE